MEGVGPNEAHYGQSVVEKGTDARQRPVGPGEAGIARQRPEGPGQGATGPVVAQQGRMDEPPLTMYASVKQCIALHQCLSIFFARCNFSK